MSEQAAKPRKTPSRTTGAPRSKRLWFVVAVCVLQAVLLTVAVALVFSEMREAAVRVPGKPTPGLAMVGGAVVSMYLAAAIGLFTRQRWARPLAQTLLVLSALATVGIALTATGDPPRPMSERWADLMALSPMLALQVLSFAVLTLTPQTTLYAKRPQR